jgi:hypothetical protein
MSTKPSLQHASGSIETIRIRRYLVNGKESTKKELTSQPFIVAGVEGETAHGFASEEALCRWAAGTIHADRFARAIGTMKLGQQLEGTTTGARALKRIEAATERLQDELRELSEETGLAIGSPEFLAQANTSATLLAAAPIPTTLLFDKVVDPGLPPVFGGTFIPVIATIPSFLGFNDKASGAIVVGLCTLHDKTFFRGPAAFLFGAPFARFVLDDLGFDNRAASGIAIL